MEQTVEIDLHDHPEPIRPKTLQLYSSLVFHLPEFGDYEVDPFPEREAPPPIEEPASEPPPTCSFTYNVQYERVIGSSQSYPLNLCLSNKHIIVACRQEIILFDMLDFSVIGRLPCQQLVTSMDAEGDNLVVGCATGQIICWSLQKQLISCEIGYFGSGNLISRVKWVRYCRLCAIDSFGSLVFFDLHHRTIMERKVATTIDTYPIYQEQRGRTTEKLKRMWKNLLHKEEPAAEQPQPDICTYFTMAHSHYGQFVDNSELIVAVFRKRRVTATVLARQKLTLKSEQNLLEDQQLSEVGVFTFGLGGFDASNHTYLLLAVSYGHSMNYFKYVRVDDCVQWHHVFNFQMERVALSGNFTSNNILTYLTEQGIELGNVGSASTLICRIDFSRFSYVDYFNTEEGLGLNKRTVVYRNMLKSRWQENMFCCLEGKRLVLGTIESWQSYLNILTNQSKWEQAMVYALQIYQGKLKLLAGINENAEQRNLEMKDFFEKITMTYLSFEMKKEDPRERRDVLRRAVMFMLATENQHHLFTTVLEAVDALQHKQMFFDVLEEAILQRRVSFVPADALVECIKTYKQQGKQELLELLILHLDLEKVDRLVLLQTCLRFQMFRSLIHICVSQEDYVTPLIKLCALINVEQEERQGQQQAGNILFWFIKGCLQGIFIDAYLQEKYLQMLEKLVTYVFVPVTLKILCKIDPKRYFILVCKFFQPRILQLILENSQRFLVKKNSLQLQPLFEGQGSQQFQIYENMLKNVIFTDYHFSERVQPQLERFIVYLVLKNQFNFNEQFRLLSVQYFMQTPFIFCQNESSEANQEGINAYLMRLFDLSLTRSAHPLQLCEQFVGRIFNLDRSELLAESLCYLYHQLGRYGKCLQLYLRMKDYDTRERVLLYLEHNLGTIEQLYKQTLNNIVSLVKINEERALRLLANLLPNSCEEIINKLVAYPKYQLRYLELVFQNKHALTDQLKLIHLGIVLKYEKQEVEYFLRKMDYPLDEAYRICEESGHKPAMAYLACKKGMAVEGAMILTDVFCQVSDEVVKAIARKQQPNRNVVYDRLREMLDVCCQEYKVDPVQGENIWFSCLERVFKHIKIENLVKENIPLAIRELLNDIVSLVLEKLCEEVNVDFFINRFTKSFSMLPFNVFSKAYLLMKERLKYTEKTLNLTKALIADSHLLQNTAIAETYHRGLVGQQLCCHCGKQLSEMSVVFPCRHCFHFDCVGEYRCMLCRNDLKYCLSESSRVLSYKPDKLPLDRNTTNSQRLRQFDERAAIEQERLHSY